MIKIRSAIVGLGRIGSLLEKDRFREKPASHAGAIFHNPKTILISGCDPDEKKRAFFKKDWGVSKVYASQEEMLLHERIDLLHIATPPKTHLSCVKLVLKYGSPFIICEKPLADTLKASKKILKLVEKNQLHFLVNHERRYARDYQEVKKKIIDFTYGKLLSIHARLFMGTGRTPSEILWDDGTHLFDLFYFLCPHAFRLIRSVGDPDKKSAQMNILGNMGEVMVSIDVGGKRDHLAFEIDLAFEKGFIRIGNGVYEEFKSEKSRFYEKMRSLTKVKTTSFNKTYYFANMLKEAVDFLEGKNKDLRFSLRDVYRALESIHFILKKTF